MAHSNDEVRACLTCVCVLEGHTERVWHAAWHPTRDMLATTSSDRTIRIWAPKRTLTAASLTEDCDASSAGAAWACRQVLDDFTTRTARAAEWSPDGRFLACASFDAMVTVWLLKPDTGVLESVSTLEGHENEVKSVAWSPSGDVLATCGRDKSVWLWALDEVDMEFDCAAVLHGHTQDVKFVKWHPRRELLFSASYDDSIRVWGEAEDDWVCLDTLNAHTSTVWSLAFDDSGSTLVSCSEDCSLVVWLARPAAPHENPHNVVDALRYVRSHSIDAAHSRTIFSLDVRRSASGPDAEDTHDADGVANAIARTDSSQRKRRRDADTDADGTAPAGGAAASDADASWFADAAQVLASAGADDAINLYCPTTRTEPPSGWSLSLRVPGAHDSDVNCVRWHPRVRGLLASTGDDHLVKLWRLARQK